MKTEFKKADKCQVKLTVTLDAAEAEKIIKDVEKVFMREAQMPGFRKGKMPIDLIRREFKSQLKQEIETSLVREWYPKAVKEAGIEAINLAGVDEIACDRTAARFVAVVEVKPEFKLPTYKGLKIEFKDAKVDDAAVNDQVERLRAAYAKYEDGKDGDSAGEGDFIQIDYDGTIGGKPIAEINPEAKFVASGRGHWTQLEEGRFLPEILDAVRGMKAGETKEGIKAKFDKNAAPDGLKGEKAVYTVKLISVRHRILPSDAEFAEKAKAESFEKLVANIRETLEKNAVEQESVRRENEAVELLMKKVDFDVPESQMRAAASKFLEDFAQRAQYSGLDADYFEKNREKILKDAQDAGARQVRLWYVIEAIAKAEKIEGKDDEIGKKVIEFVLANAKK